MQHGVFICRYIAFARIQHETERPTGIRQRHDEQLVFSPGADGLVRQPVNASMQTSHAVFRTDKHGLAVLVNLMAKHPLGVHSVVTTSHLADKLKHHARLTDTALCSKKPRNAHG